MTTYTNSQLVTIMNNAYRAQDEVNFEAAQAELASRGVQVSFQITADEYGHHFF